MHFFANEGLGAQGSGIEHAQVQRQKLFRKYGTPSKIVTRNFDQNGHRNLLAWELNDAEVVNLFDYYQRTEYVKDKIVTVDDVDWDGREVHLKEKMEENENEVVYGLFEDEQKTRFLGRVHTDPKNENRVTMVEVFEHFGNLYRLDSYDSRGFVTRQQLMDPDGKINTNLFLDIDGNPVIEEFVRYRPSRGTEKALKARKISEEMVIRAENAKASGTEPAQPDEKEVTEQQKAVEADMEIGVGYRLTKRTGLQYMLDDFEGLSREFYNDLNNDFFSKKNPNVWILDRTSSSESVIFTLDRPAYVGFHIHNLHASDTRNVMTTEENNNYEFGFAHYNDYDTFISAMPRQSADIEKRYKPVNMKTFTIPVGVVPQAIRDGKKVPMKDRKAGSVLMIVRRAPDKRIAAVTEALIIAKDKNPELPLHLDAYGYFDNTGNNKTIRDIVRAFEKHGKQRPKMFNAKGEETTNIAEAQKIDSDILTIHDYVTDREELYSIHKEHQIYGLASIMEGFNISMMEAMANGLPGVSTNVNYGPNDLIIDGENGYLTAWAPDGEEDEFVSEMADRFIELFSDEKKLQKFSDKAYELSERYYEENVWKAWQELDADAEKSWKDKVKNAKEPSIYGNGLDGVSTEEFYPVGVRADEDTTKGIEGDKYLKKVSKEAKK